VAAAAVALTRPRPTSDYLGIGLGLLAACCWAGYILLNRSIGRTLPGAEGSAAAAALSGLAFVPIGAFVLVHHPPTVRALACAGAAGVLSSAVPFLADLLALRRVPARFFGVFMSVNPVLAAVAGLVVLGQALYWTQWLAILVIVTANSASVLTARAP
jgi:inner membrane transporter RhtA